MNNQSTFHSASNFKQTLNKFLYLPIVAVIFGIVASILGETIFPFVFFVVFVVIIFTLSTLFTKGTEMIEIDTDENRIIINKEKKEHILTENILYQNIAYRSSDGIKFKLSDKEIHIWKYEFSKVNWEEILQVLKSFELIKEHDTVYSPPKDKY